MTVKDNDKGVNLSPLSLEVQEGDTTGERYTAWLNTQPSNTVTVAITGATSTDLTLDPDSLTFTRDDWSIPQSVTVTAANDDDGIEDTATLTHTPSGGDYEGLAASTLPVTVRERTGVTIRPTSLVVMEGDTAGASYGVVLDSRPSDDVTVTVISLGKRGCPVEHIHADLHKTDLERRTARDRHRAVRQRSSDEEALL